MEYIIGLLITGSFILLVALYRLRKVRQHHGLQHQIQEAYDVSNLDLSGNTRYASCYSHDWVMNNISKKSHSRIGAMLQDHLANNTLLAGMWIGLIVGTSSMLLTLLLVQSLRTIGTVIVIFVVGALIALGPGGPRYSEGLLDAVMKNQIENLNAQDFVYVKLANDTIRRAIIANIVLASVFIITAPWGDMLPTLLAQGVAVFTVNLIWEPAFFLLNINIAFALIYIASVIGIGSLACLKLGQRLTSQEENAPTTHY
jgi:hypothetical protein